MPGNEFKIIQVKSLKAVIYEIEKEGNQYCFSRSTFVAEIELKHCGSPSSCLS